MSEAIECHIYRSKHKSGLYLYLREKDKFAAIPSVLKAKLGKLEFAFSMSLDESTKLVRLNSGDVMKKLNQDGYFLQMPPANSNFLDLNLHQSDGF